MSIVIVDDHGILRVALAEWLRRCGFDVIGTFDRADGLLASLDRLEPDIVLLDVEMPGVDAFTAAAEIVRRSTSRVVFLTAYANERFVRRALEIPVAGYILKAEAPDDLAAGLRRVAAGGTCFSDDLRRRHGIEEHGVLATDESQPLSLTARELEIIRYLVRGLTDREIAERVGARPKTVGNHLANIMRKLRVRNRTALAMLAVQEGVVAELFAGSTGAQIQAKALGNPPRSAD